MWLAGTLIDLLPRPEIAPEACSRRLGSGCTECVDACPKDALESDADRAPIVDPLACISCGLCESRCPTGAVIGVAAAPSLVVGASRGTVLRLRCEPARMAGARLGRGPGLDVGCVGSVHPETVAAACGGGGTVELVVADCASCPLGDAARVPELAAAAGRVIGDTSRIRIVEDDGPAPPEASRPPQARLSRRALLRPRPGPERAATVRTSRRDEADPRRLLLSTHPAPVLPRPEVSTGCTACGACVAACPAEALSIRDDGEESVLLLDAAACIGCEDCARICPEQIVELADAALSTHPVSLATVHTMRCEKCRIPLSAGEKKTCTGCISRASLVADVWAEILPGR